MQSQHVNRGKHFLHEIAMHNTDQNAALTGSVCKEPSQLLALATFLSIFLLLYQEISAQIHKYQWQTSFSNLFLMLKCEFLIISYVKV